MISEPLSKKEAEIMGYFPARILPTGICCGLLKGNFPYDLFVGLDRNGYRTRFCYNSLREAKKALEEWDGIGDPPGNWIKEKPMERSNPNYIPLE